MIRNHTFLFVTFKGDLTMKANAEFDEILTFGYLINGFSDNVYVDGHGKVAIRVLC